MRIQPDRKGTAPLGTGPLQPPTSPRSVAPGAPGGKPRGTAPLDESQVVGFQARASSAAAPDLDALQVPEAPEPPKPQEGGGGLFGAIGRAVGGVIKSVTDTVHEVKEKIEDAVEVVEEVVETTVQAVQDGVEEVGESLREGQSVGDALKDGVKEAGKTIYREGVDPLLDRSALGADDQFQDTGMGALGPLLTNRLAVGESVDIRIEAGATLPTELVGAPNIKLDQGGTLKIKRVLAFDANNQPIIDPKTGRQATRLEVRIEADARVGAGYSANVGFTAKGEAGGWEAGVDAGARAEAEAGLTGSVAITLQFDPDSPDVGGDLAALIGSVAADGAAKVVPGLDRVLGQGTEADRRAALARSRAHIESIEGEGGMYAAVSAGAQLEAGVERQEGDDPAAGGLLGKAGEFASEKAAGAIEDRLHLVVAGLSANAGASVQIGGTKNVRTGESTVTLSVDGKLEGEATLVNQSIGAGVGTNRQVELHYSREGELDAIRVKQTYTKEEWEAIRTTLEDLYGRPLDPGFVASVTRGDTVEVTFDLRPEVLARIKAKVESGDPAALLEAATTLLHATISKDDYLVKQGCIVSTHRDEFRLSVNLGAAFGAQIGVRGGVTLGHEQETVG